MPPDTVNHSQSFRITLLYTKDERRVGEYEPGHGALMQLALSGASGRILLLSSMFLADVRISHHLCKQL